MGRDICAALLKCHAITGCDVTSKLGTKANALNANLQLLLDFGKSVHPDSSSFLQAERYLCYVLYPNAHCNYFDALRYYLYTKKNKTITQLPPTSHMLHGHLLRSHYFVWIHSNLLETDENQLDPKNFGWKSINYILLPDEYTLSLPDAYSVTCGCKKQCGGRCSCKKSNILCTEFCKSLDDVCKT